tara:strand:+ start:211 stop:768 length:558 start_codon:yes stop_codon:yes gene_type:complete
MTDLNLLYGSDDNLMGDQMDRKEGGLYTSQISGQQLHKMASQNDMVNDDKNQQTQQNQQLQQVQQQQMQNQMKQQVPQQVPQQVQQQVQQQVHTMQQPNQRKEVMNYQKMNEYSFMDRMNMKRSEVVKLALFSLVIVLGISIDRMFTYYLSRYVEDNVLTDFQELLLRLSYPIAVFLLLWLFKAI